MNRREALDWVNGGRPCIYRRGWRWKGADAKEITKEEALELFPKYTFGKGFRELSFTIHKGRSVLEFNELSESDMY